ncbi:hypothetical protein CGZ96_18150 [Enemella evansiae]|nr:hypothetical protein CGZ96_18150 [Enemella evansiae]OYO04432.1 hypothetical protein CGZ95_03730 [Enemella evansiae]OYO06304.1 hypothetical protein CGZ97_06630 [Enemella evansiae]
MMGRRARSGKYYPPGSAPTRPGSGLRSNTVETVKTRDTAAAEEAARIWAKATAKRDENQASDANSDEAVGLIEETLNHSERSFLLYLTTEEGMMAFAAIEPSRDADETVGEIRYLGVAPGHWGEGWARRLLVAVPGALRENEFGSGELWVYADNIRAIFVYEAMGWIGTTETRRHPVTNRVEQKFVLKLG